MKRQSRYKLKLNHRGKLASILEEEPQKNRTKKFSCIYAFKYRSKIIRIGETTAGFSRIRNGLTKNIKKQTKKGRVRDYYSYKWRTRYKGKVIELYMFELDEIKEKNVKKSLSKESN
jgi:hypothetical protein